MKRVLFFLESLSNGGAEKILSAIVSNLDSKKYNVTVCTVTDEGIYQEKVSKYCRYYSFVKVADYHAGGLRKIRYRSELYFIYHAPIQKVYRKYITDNYDIEVAFIEGYAVKFIAASANRFSKKVTWVHIDMKKNPYAEKYFNSHRQHYSAYKSYKRICCVSENVRRTFENMFFDDTRVVVQYNPVDSEDIVKKAEEKVDLIPNSILQLGTIGRLEEQKGYIRLVDMLGKLYNKGYEFGLWIMGEGSQRQQIENLIEKYHLENNVKLVGFQTNPYKYMSKCDAFICSSYAEGFSTAATEALILGKPIFTTDCAGMEELFGMEKCGEIVPNTDEELFGLLERLVSGNIEIYSFSQAIKRRAVDFDIKKRMKEIEKLLDSV